MINVAIGGGEIRVTGFLKDWLINIITFLVCTVVLEIITPSGKLKKFVNLIIGFIFIIVLMNPFLKLVHKKIDLTQIQIPTASQYADQNLVEDGDVLRKKNTKKIIEVYKAKLEDQVKKIILESDNSLSVESINITVDEEESSNNIGEIRQINIILSSDKKTYTSKIEKIKIGNESTTLSYTNKESPKTDIEKKIIEKISSSFGIEKKIIAISTK